MEVIKQSVSIMKPKIYLYRTISRRRFTVVSGISVWIELLTVVKFEYEEINKGILYNLESKDSLSRYKNNALIRIVITEQDYFNWIFLNKKIQTIWKTKWNISNQTRKGEKFDKHNKIKSWFRHVLTW